MKHVLISIACLLSLLYFTATPANAVNVSVRSLDALIADSGGDATFVGGAAHLNIPFSLSFSAQLDLSGGEFLDQGTLTEVGTHVFHRSQQYLLGVFYGHAEFEGLTGDQIAMEWERYDDQWLTVRGTLGYEFKNVNNDLRFGELLLRLYLTTGKNFMFESGLYHVDSATAEFHIDNIELGMRFEILLERLNLSVFAEQYRRNDGEFRTIGIRYFWGERKSLIRRHREDGIFNVH